MFAIRNSNGNFLRWLKEGIWNREGKGSKDKAERVYTFSVKGCSKNPNGTWNYSATIKKAIAHLTEIGYTNFEVVEYDGPNSVRNTKSEFKNSTKAKKSVIDYSLPAVSGLPIPLGAVPGDEPGIYVCSDDSEVINIAEIPEDNDENLMFEDGYNPLCMKCAKCSVCGQSAHTEIWNCNQYRRAV